MSKVCVTGASGFLGAHCVVALLRAGHSVRGTVRDLDRAEEVRAMVRRGDADCAYLELVSADLNQDDGWEAAVQGCDFVLHVASPFPAHQPRDEAELIAPARDGALRVLRAARDEGVRRVVLTSSFAAVGYGHEQVDRVFDENDWTEIGGTGVQPYIKSKALAERAAWAFMTHEGDGLELSVINPVGIFGPLLGSALSASVDLVRQLLSGVMAETPRIHFGVVDVRDIAELHLRAMLHPAARGERFIGVSGRAFSLHEVAMILRDGLGDAAAGVPTAEMPDDRVRELAETSATMAALVPQLGIVREASADKARRLLEWMPHPPEEALLASARSLLALHLQT